MRHTSRAGNSSRSSAPLDPALFAASPYDVEAEAARLIAAQTGFASRGVHVSDFIEQPGVSRRIAARRAADRRLIDLDQLIDLTDAAEAGMRSCFRSGSAQCTSHGASQCFLHQRALARTAAAGHANH